MLTGISDSYLTLSEDDQCSLYGAIGQVACESTRSATDNMVVDRNMLWKKCCICDADVAGSGLLAPWEGPESEEMFSAITYLIKLLKKQNLRRPRVAAMLALKRLLSHTINKDHLNITTSTPGQWCLQALHSSIRELRVAAG